MFSLLFIWLVVLVLRFVLHIYIRLRSKHFLYTFMLFAFILPWILHFLPSYFRLDGFYLLPRLPLFLYTS